MKNYTLGARLLGTSAYAVLLLAVAQSAAAQTAENTVPETVTVTATRLQAQQIKEAAPNVLDLRLVDDIQQLPDVNLAEALQRIPGVSLETDSGEGRFINIRGMDADLNGTTYDGVRLTASNASTPQGGGRAIAFDAFPSGIMGGVEVVKSLTPDIDAEGLGGIVNILPRTIPGGVDYMLEGTLGSGVETLRGSPVWEGSVTGGMHFGPRDSMSVLFSYEYHSDWRNIDDLENSGPSTDFNAAGQPIPNDLEFRWYKYHRTRQGLAGSYTWDIDASSSVYLRAFDAGYTEYAQKHRLEIDNTQDLGAPPMIGNQYQVTDAQFVQNYTDSKETVQNKLIEGGGHTTFAGDILADFKLSWTEGDDVTPFSYGFQFTDPNTHPLQYDVTTNPNFPTFQALDGTNPTNPANYTAINLNNSSSKTQDQEIAAAFNLTAPFDFGDVEGDFKVGGNVRGRVRRVISAANNGVSPTGSLAQFAQSNDQIYYENHYNIGPMANLPELAAIPEDPLVVDPTSFEHDNENVYAGYAQYAGGVGPWSFLGGVRVEHTDATYNAIIADSSGNIAPSQNKQSYTNVFPDINGKWQATDDLLVRAAFTTSLARPGFNQITAAKSFDYANDIVSQGNPDVKPTTADNFDLTSDWHTPLGGVASVGLFYKSFSNYIIPTEASGACPMPIGSGVFSGPNCQFQSFQNIGSATAKGLELSFVQQFTFLPDFWSGFGIDGNFTYVATRGDIRTGEEHSLPQTSPRNFNAEVFYEKGPVTLRLAGSYVSTNLWQVGSDATQDLYSQARFRLDFGGSYKITDNVEWYVDVKNITNTKLEFTQTASPQFPVQREFYDMDVFFGVRAHL